MNVRFYYQLGALSVCSADSRSIVIFQSPFALLAECRSGQEVFNALLCSDASRTVYGAINGPSYTPYGHRFLGPREPVLAFNGQPRDRLLGSDLLGQGKRAFNPGLMRFNSPDTYAPFSVGGLNQYAYCSDDPVNHTDPTGNMRRANTAPVNPRPRRLPTAAMVLVDPTGQEGYGFVFKGKPVSPAQVNTLREGISDHVWGEALRKVTSDVSGYGYTPQELAVDAVVVGAVAVSTGQTTFSSVGMYARYILAKSTGGDYDKLLSGINWFVEYYSDSNIARRQAAQLRRLT